MLSKMKKRTLSIFMIFALLGTFIPAMVGVAAAADSPQYVPSVSEATYSHVVTSKPVKPSVGGKLQLLEKNGIMTLCDENGNPIQLRGMSTHGLQWFPQIINNNAFAALSNDWDANVIRLAMYVGETGYNDGHPEVKQKVIDGIDYAIANDMYVIVDWHVHNPGDPNAPIYSGALDFFEEISGLYPNDPHIIYELANEPNPGGDQGVTNDVYGWQAVKSYAEPIIQMLRNNGNENIIIVGSPNWSQRADLAADNPINDDKTMYTVHFYTGTHQAAADSSDRTNVMSNARYALEHGVALFATEWGTSEASGNNGPYLPQADAWLDFLNANNISWSNWSLTNKAETSAAFSPFEAGKSVATDLDPGADQVWAPKELTVSGEYVRARIKGIPLVQIDRSDKEEFSTTVFDFNDGTQGFGENGDSPIKPLTFTHVNGTLQIAGLQNSSDLTNNIWGNARISADAAGLQVNIQGAEKMTMDVIAAQPTKVSISAVPQSAAIGWGDTSPALVTESDFVLQGDGTYKALLTLTTTNARSLGLIAEHETDNTLTNMILFVGTDHLDSIALDNITISGARKVVQNPIVHAPLGTTTVPSDFNEGNRQGWAWDPESGVKSAMTVETANGSPALSWEVTFTEEKPGGWASAPRVKLPSVNTTRGDNQYLAFDFYLKPTLATKGGVPITLVFAPQDASYGYWQQVSESFYVSFASLSQMPKTADGLYHFKAYFDVTTTGKLILPDTVLRDIQIIVSDDASDYSGRMYVDNVRFTNVAPPEAPAGLQATAGDAQVLLKWNAVSGADSYKVWRSTSLSGTFKVVASNVAGTTFTDSSVLNNSTYYYKVTAQNATGEGHFSNHTIAMPAGSGGGGGPAPAPSSEVVNLPQADKDGKIAVSIANGTKKVLLPANAAAANKQSKLELKNDDVTVQIPGSVLNKLQGLVSAEELKDATISFQMEPVSSTDSSSLLDKAKTKNNANVTAAGDVLEFSISIVSKDGKETRLTQFEEPISISLKVSGNAKKELLGIYYIADDGTLEYVGGKLVDGKLVADITHFSKYAVLSYDKDFADVSSSFWAVDVIKQMAAKHIIQGVSDTQFAPNKEVTRAEFAALIVRALGLTAKDAASFSDVSAGDWYASAIAAASEAGIVTGRSDSEFAPNATITREEMAVMLVRAYEHSKGGKAAAGASAAFADQDSISSWAQAAVKSAQSLGYINGRDNNQFVPKGVATRAESAQVIAKLIAE